MKKSGNALFIIDMQNDFCKQDGALYVPGAEDDIQRLISFIDKTKIDKIILTADTHEIIDISHPEYWSNDMGDCPEPFTQITTKDVDDKKWFSADGSKWGRVYVEELEIQGEYPHVIWPIHCVRSSWGAEIVDEIKSLLPKHEHEIVKKGLNPHSEHFGAFKANISVKNDPTTDFNEDLLVKLKAYENIYIAGEAKSHCVANTIKQMLPYTNDLGNIYILEDCMSNVPGFENIADDIYHDAVISGMQIINS